VLPQNGAQGWGYSWVRSCSFLKILLDILGGLLKKLYQLFGDARDWRSVYIEWWREKSSNVVYLWKITKEGTICYFRKVNYLILCIYDQMYFSITVLTESSLGSDCLLWKHMVSSSYSYFAICWYRNGFSGKLRGIRNIRHIWCVIASKDMRNHQRYRFKHGNELIVKIAFYMLVSIRILLVRFCLFWFRHY
jgi:hypothetical protein